MATSPSTGRYYNPTAVAMHWFVLGLVVAVYACILLRENYPRGSDIREALKTWHYMLGLSVWALVLVRIVLRLFVWKAPRITPAAPRWQMLLAHVVHLGIYAFMFLMPLGGWLLLSAEGDPVPFWVLQLPSAPIAPSETLADQIKALHETGRTIGYFLIGLHAVAALYHHYVVRDDTLKRMLPHRDQVEP